MNTNQPSVGELMGKVITNYGANVNATYTAFDIIVDLTKYVIVTCARKVGIHFDTF